MALSTLEHFIRFGTDAAGIERILRMVQAILMVVISQPLLTAGFVKLVGLGNENVWIEPRSASILVLTDLRGKVALARRFFRMFRFLESFHAAQVIYTSFYAPLPPPAAATTTASTPASSVSSGNQAGEKASESNKSQQSQPNTLPRPNRQGVPTEAWLDIFSRTFNGMYLLLETATLIDALQVPGFSLWGGYWSPVMHVEGQRFWFFALLCGLAGGLLRLVKVFAYAPVPQTGEGYGTGEVVDGREMQEWERERERLRGLMRARKEARRAWLSNVRTKGWRLGRRCVADLLDLAVPGSVVGWVRIGSGSVGLVMVVTTYITGLEIWERCASV